MGFWVLIYSTCTNKGSHFIKVLIAMGPLARSDASPACNQTFTGSIPGPAHSFVEIWS